MKFSTQNKIVLNVMIHVGIFSSALLVSLELKYGHDFILANQTLTLTLVLVAVAFKVIIFAMSGLFTGWWRYVSIPDLFALLKANLLGTSLCYFFFLVRPDMFVPLSPTILVIDGLVCFLLTAGVRIMVRVLSERHCEFEKDRTKVHERVLVVGAGATGQTIVREIRQCTKLNQKVLGYVDNDPQRQNQSFQGLPVLGVQNDLDRICLDYKITSVIVARSALCPRNLREIVERCREASVKVKILPAVGEILNGDVTIQKIRDVQIEDLLGRTPVGLDTDTVRPLVENRNVLVTGAGGSIGSEICRQISRLGPASLILFDHGETPLFHIEREVRREAPHVRLKAILGDSRDERVVNSVFRNYAPAIVFHAAAYKHVAMSENNPSVAIHNNIFGSRNMARAANKYGADVFVQISTDKAVNPTSVMGASKRFAERVIQDYSSHSKVKFVTVRFGNVLGSNGSVVQVFKDQIAKGGPVTVTHPEVTRFFMTIPEAVNLVLHASMIGRNGNTYLLDMGEPVKILKLAEEMIRLSGLKPYEDIDIEMIGLCNGEKLYEELLLSEEGTLPTEHEKICAAQQCGLVNASMGDDLEDLEAAIQRNDKSGIFKVLLRVVPEYTENDYESSLVTSSEEEDGQLRQTVPPHLLSKVEPGSASIHSINPGV